MAPVPSPQEPPAITPDRIEPQSPPEVPSPTPAIESPAPGHPEFAPTAPDRDDPDRTPPELLPPAGGRGPTY